VPHDLRHSRRVRRAARSEQRSHGAEVRRPNRGGRQHRQRARRLGPRIDEVMDRSARDEATIAGSDPAVAFEELFDRNRWPAAWRNGVYPFHHFHSNAHEALGVYSGEVTVQFGGDDGIVVTARPGDVIVLPAGTGHKRLAWKGALGIVGAYPAGQHPDMCRLPVSASDVISSRWRNRRREMRASSGSRMVITKGD